MAAAKGRRPASAKSGGGKKPVAGKSGAKKRNAAAQQNAVFSAGVAGLIMFGLGVLLIFCLLSTASSPALVFIRSFINGLFGSTRILAVAMICILGLQIAFGDRWPFRKSALLLLTLLVFLFATLLQVFRLDDLLFELKSQQYSQNYNGFLWISYVKSQNIPLGGGFVGALLGFPLGKYLDVVGSALLLFFAMGVVILLLIRTVFPSAGEYMGGWWSQFRDDWVERRDEKREEREARREAELRAQGADAALLVPVPKELLENDEEDEYEEESPPVRGAKGRKPAPAASPRPVPMKQRPAPAPTEARRPMQQPQSPQPRQPETKQPMPQTQQSRQTPQPSPNPPRGAQRPAAYQPTLFIEDILPDHYSSVGDAYTQEDAERVKHRSRPSRKDPDILPDFLTKRRAQYDAAYGTFSTTEPVQAEVVPVEDVIRDQGVPPQEFYDDGYDFQESIPMEMEQAPWDGVFDDAIAEPSIAQAGSTIEDPVWNDGSTVDRAWDEEDETPWETIEPSYNPDDELPKPTRRRRARMENPLDYQPTLDPETRLDKPDWKPPEEPKVEAIAEVEEYRQPPFSLLIREELDNHKDTRTQDAVGAQKLEETLASFGVEAHVIKVVHGPAITRYELQPAAGVKVSKIVNLTDDIALNMAAIGVRIEAPIPGKAAIGIELANDEIETVHLRDVLESDESLKHPSRLAVALGKDIAGKRIIADLARMPHLLIAGATGSGKSVCINTLITSIIYRATPEEVRLILIDPKKVELSVYNGIPHLLVPVVTDAKKASGALSWAVMEMDERYRLFADVGVRDIRGYNAQRDSDVPLMPQIVVIIDELSDLMLVAPGEVEESICRLAQLARACGIHLVIATQRPSVNVITGIIKANIPSRIAFAVSSQVDSRTILDSAGADKLLGKGDMLFAPSGGGKPMRVQGCFVSDDEVKRVADYVKDRHTVDYSQAVIDALANTGEDQEAPDEDLNDLAGDALFQQAVEMAVESGQASISMLQRRLRVGYARAGRLVDEMARRNIIGQAEGAKPREVLITREDMALMFKK